MSALAQPYTISKALPYRHLNLRRNPFGVPHERDRPDLAVANVDDWADRLQNERIAIQLVGHHGRGKSSHLFALKRVLERRGQHVIPYVRLRDQRRIPVAPIVLLDEGARLPLRAWWTLRHVRSLAVSTHLNLRPLLWCLGFKVVTQHIRQLDPERLHRIFQRRIEWARDAPGPIPQLSVETVHALQKKYDCNIRAMEYALYQSIDHMNEVGFVRLLD